MTLSQIRHGWNRFFHEPTPATTMGAYRLLLGVILVAYAAVLAPDLSTWFSEKGVLPFEASKKIAGRAGFSLFDFLPHTDASVQAVFGLYAVASVCVMIGFGSRISTIIALITLTSLHHRNTLMLNSGDFFLRLACFWMMFADSGRAFSVDRLIRLARGASPATEFVSPWPLRMVQLQLAMLYFMAVLWKLRGSMWLDGTAIYYTSRLMEFWKFPTPYVFEHMWTIKLATWGTLVIEFALGAMLWIKDLRYWILLAGVFLHLGIDWTMNIPLFAPVMITAYLTWVAPEDLDRAFAWMRERVNRLSKFSLPIPVFYDGKCSFCTRSVAIMSRFDSLRRIRWLDMHAAENKAAYPDLDLGRGANEMLLRLPDGKWLGGFDAFRAMAKHFPIFWIVYPILFIPPVPAIGRWIYRRIAARRYCILTLPPKRAEVPAPALVR